MLRALCFSNATRYRRTSARFIAVGAFAAFLVAWCSSTYAINRKIYDCGDPFGDTVCYMDTFSSAYNYTFGRSEGRPVRGPNPVAGFQYGSTDVDTLYDLMGTVQNYYMDKFNRNGPNGLGG